jgi:hypothetical protein
VTATTRPWAIELDSCWLSLGLTQQPVSVSIFDSHMAGRAMYAEGELPPVRAGLLGGEDGLDVIGRDAVPGRGPEGLAGVAARDLVDGGDPILGLWC